MDCATFYFQHAYASCSVSQERNFIPVNHQPTSHPPQRNNSEYKKRSWKDDASNKKTWKTKQFINCVLPIFIKLFKR